MHGTCIKILVGLFRGLKAMSRLLSCRMWRVRKVSMFRRNFLPPSSG